MKRLDSHALGRSQEGGWERDVHLEDGGCSHSLHRALTSGMSLQGSPSGFQTAVLDNTFPIPLAAIHLTRPEPPAPSLLPVSSADITKCPMWAFLFFKLFSQNPYPFSSTLPLSQEMIIQLFQNPFEDLETVWAKNSLHIANSCLFLESALKWYCKQDGFQVVCVI